MSWVDDTFGGRNPKVGVNHVHWVMFCPRTLGHVLSTVDVNVARIIVCALLCFEYTIFVL